MEGLLSQGSQSSKQNPGEASPEQEALMEEALAETGKVIYANDAAADALLDTIASAKTPEAGIGVVVSQVVGVMDQKMDLPEDFIVPLSEAVTYMIVEMADKAGIVEASDDVIERSLMEAAKNIGQDYEVGEENIASAMQDETIASEVKRVGGLYAGQA